MRISNTFVYNPKIQEDEQIKQIWVQIDKIIHCLQGRVSFGTGVDGVSGQNIEGEWQSFTTPAGADTEFNVAHTIGSVPLGYIVVSQDKAGNLYQQAGTGTAWTSIQISLKCSASSVSFLVFLVKKGQAT